MRLREHVIVAVVAMDSDRVIGDGKKLLWDIPEDRERANGFARGKPVIMGRKTYESMGKSLPDSTVIVLTRSKEFSAEGVLVAHDATDAHYAALTYLDALDPDNEEVIIFGGEEVYREFLPLTTRIEMTRVYEVCDGDVKFPEIDLREWDISNQSAHPAVDGRPGYAYTTLTRKKEK